VLEVEAKVDVAIVVVVEVVVATETVVEMVSTTVAGRSGSC